MQTWYVYYDNGSGYMEYAGTIEGTYIDACAWGDIGYGATAYETQQH